MIILDQQTKIWLVMLAVGLLTFATRLSFILLFGRMEIPLPIRKALRYVPPAVLSALIFPELLLPGGELNLSFGNEYLLAGMVASAVAWLSKNVVATIIVGMVTLLLAQSLSL